MTAKERKNPFGRPREHDLDEWAEKLIEWSKKEDSSNLNGFCADNMLPPTYITRWAREDKHFCSAYEYAKAQLGARRERKLAEGTLHVKAYDLNAKVYDEFLKQEHRQEMEYEASLKNNQDTYTPEQAKLLTNFMASVDKLQHKENN